MYHISLHLILMQIDFYITEPPQCSWKSTRSICELMYECTAISFFLANGVNMHLLISFCLFLSASLFYIFFFD